MGCDDFLRLNIERPTSTHPFRKTSLCFRAGCQYVSRQFACRSVDAHNQRRQCISSRLSGFQPPCHGCAVVSMWFARTYTLTMAGSDSELKNVNLVLAINAVLLWEKNNHQTVDGLENAFVRSKRAVGAEEWRQFFKKTLWQSLEAYG